MNIHTILVSVSSSSLFAMGVRCSLLVSPCFLHTLICETEHIALPFIWMNSVDCWCTHKWIFTTFPTAINDICLGMF